MTFTVTDESEAIQRIVIDGKTSVPVAGGSVNLSEGAHTMRVTLKSTADVDLTISGSSVDHAADPTAVQLFVAEGGEVVISAVAREYAFSGTAALTGYTLKTGDDWTTSAAGNYTAGTEITLQYEIDTAADLGEATASSVVLKTSGGEAITVTDAAATRTAGNGAKAAQNEPTTAKYAALSISDADGFTAALENNEIYTKDSEGKYVAATEWADGETYYATEKSNAYVPAEAEVKSVVTVTFKMPKAAVAVATVEVTFA